MVFRPVPAKERWDGVLLCVWVLITLGLLLQWISRRPTDWLRFALVALVMAGAVLLLHVAYRTWAAFSLEYWLDRNALTVRWADARQTIPLAGLRRILVGALPEGAEAALPRASWLDWPATFLRQMPDNNRDPQSGPAVALLASLPMEGCLVLDAGTTAFALSPAAPDSFIDAVQERVRMGPVANVPPAYRRRFDPASLLVFDRLGWILLGAGLAGAALLFAVLMIRLPGLPDMLAVRYTADGIPELVREKESLYLLPLIGLMSWLLNGLFGLVMAARRQKSGAYLLWSGTLVVEFCALFALLSLVGWR